MSDQTTTKTITNKRLDTRKLTGTAMLSAVAFVLMYIEVPLTGIMPPFIKFDISDLPAVIGAFAFGPLCGVVIELIKNLLHLVVSQSMFIGELSNFILGATFVLVAGGIYSWKKTKLSAFLGGVAGAVVMGLVSVVSNYYLVYPVYVAVFFGGNEQTCIDMYKLIIPSMKTLLQCLLVFNVPFTIVKGLISVVISMLIYKPLSPILKGRNN